MVFAQAISLQTLFRAQHHLVALHRNHLTVAVRDEHLPGVNGGLLLDARADNGDVGLEQRDSLALHI